MRWVLGFFFLAQGVAAQTYCIFDVECFEGDACSAAAFRIDITKGSDAGDARSPNGVQAKTEFGDLSGYMLKQTPEVVTYAFEGDGAFYFLSLEGRDARLSVHMPGPMRVGYQGTCEVLE